MELKVKSIEYPSIQYGTISESKDEVIKHIKYRFEELFEIFEKYLIQKPPLKTINNKY